MRVRKIVGHVHMSYGPRMKETCRQSRCLLLFSFCCCRRWRQETNIAQIPKRSVCAYDQSGCWFHTRASSQVQDVLKEKRIISTEANGCPCPNVPWAALSKVPGITRHPGGEDKCGGYPSQHTTMPGLIMARTQYPAVPPAFHRWVPLRALRNSTGIQRASSAQYDPSL